MLCFCPFCLEDRDFVKANVNEGYECLSCKGKIPVEYAEAFPSPVTMIGLAGFPQHGKTTYLTFSFYLLWRVLPNKWDSYSFSPLSSEAFDILFNKVREMTQNRLLPEATSVTFPVPAISRLRDLPHFGERFLLFYDVSGEVYGTPQMIPDYGRRVAKCHSLLFLINLTRFGDQWADRSFELEKLLFNYYSKGVREGLHLDPKEYQHLIVVFTAGDLLLNELPENLKGYLGKKGEYSTYLDVETKLEEMKDLSKKLKRWLQDNGLSNFVKEAKARFKSVEYTMVSATGQAAVGNRLPAGITPSTPRRVLDPIYWAIEKSRPKSRPKGVLKRFFGGWK